MIAFHNRGASTCNTFEKKKKQEICVVEMKACKRHDDKSGRRLQWSFFGRSTVQHPSHICNIICTPKQCSCILLLAAMSTIINIIVQLLHHQIHSTHLVPPGADLLAPDELERWEVSKHCCQQLSWQLVDQARRQCLAARHYRQKVKSFYHKIHESKSKISTRKQEKKLLLVADQCVYKPHRDSNSDLGIQSPVC